MKKLYSLPDDRTILDCLANDILDRNADVVRFCTILDSCHECTVISLDGAWGSGKTFFVKQVKMLLDGFCENSFFLCHMKNLRCLFYLTTEVYTISDTLSINPISKYAKLDE